MNERKTRLEIDIVDRPATLSVREWRIDVPRGQVICLHGLSVSGAEYAPIAEALNALGFDVVAPDWIGHGGSAFLSDPSAYDWTSYIKCLAAVTQRYHSPATHYVGTSWGGSLLLIFLLAQKLAPLSAAFVDVPIKATPDIKRSFQVLEQQAAMAFATVGDANDALLRLRPSFSRVPDRFKSYFDRERYRIEDGKIRFNFDPAILPAFAADLELTYNRFPQLRRINFKALFLYGVASSCHWPPDYVAVAQRLANIEYRDDMTGGHPPMLLHEEQFRIVVDHICRTHGA